MRRLLRAVVPLTCLLAVSVAGAASFPMEGGVAVNREKGEDQMRRFVLCALAMASLVALTLAGTASFPWK